MDHASLLPAQDHEDTDRSAILMMLAYVEAECRRLGSVDAARHAALAATLVQGMDCTTECLRGPAPDACAPLH